MKSRFASIHSTEGVDRVSCALRSLEAEWQRNGELRLEEFWTEQRSGAAGYSDDDLSVLVELIKADLRRRFENGQTPRAASYLELFPELRAADSRVLSLVYEEYCLEEERGKAPDLESFCDRYPDWKDSLISQLRYHRLFSEAAGRRPSLPVFPEAGQDFEEFQLQSLLGKGGMSRVFLARDLSLGGKHVVLKVTIDRGQESKVQGPLDHPHIVPVNSVVYQNGGELCGLSMPYRPGLTLDEIIARVEPGSRPRDAISLWNALAAMLGERSTAPGADGTDTESLESARIMGPRGDGWQGFPVRGTYAQGVAWIVMIYARALHYAHRRQTFHRDVKPGNLLLTIQSGPQLLDFNLAESPHAASQAQAALHGGTLPYMAPEQIEAFINPDLWAKVGARADIYSLGLVLRELLTGQKPELPEPGLPPARAFRAVLDRRSLLDTAVRRFNPAIPHALQAVAAKCLAFSPDDRYQGAQQLEHDLDRFLQHQPLTFAGNPNPCERATNWVVRNRRALMNAAGAIVLALLLYGLWHLRPVKPSNPPRVETSATFQAAVRDFNEGNLELAANRLRRLVQEYPHSPLVKFYLGFALKDDEKTKSKADQILRVALSAPNVATTLGPWARKHREVIDSLVEFADSRLMQSDNDAERFDYNESTVPDEERDRVIRRPTYEPVRDALVLAEKLDPTRHQTQFWLAKTERLFGDYARGYQRLSTLINAKKLDRPLLFSCYELRGWIAFLWAERERRDERSSPTDQTRERLFEAVEDLERCNGYLNSRVIGGPMDGNEIQAMRRKVYHSLHNRMRAMLTLAEVEADLWPKFDARTSLKRAKKMLAPLNEYIESYGLKKKVPGTDDLEERLRALDGRLTVLGKT